VYNCKQHSNIRVWTMHYEAIMKWINKRYKKISMRNVTTQKSKVAVAVVVVVAVQFFVKFYTGSNLDNS